MSWRWANAAAKGFSPDLVTGATLSSWAVWSGLLLHILHPSAEDRQFERGFLPCETDGISVLEFE